MKIIEFTAENVKRVRAVTIRPDGNLVQITGANGSGKSSTLDALDWLFSGARHIQGDPIRNGEDRAVITADLGEMVVTRTIRRSAKDSGKKFTTALTVEAANGARFQKPQDVVDGFMSAMSLDPIEFMQKEPKAQYDVLRSFVPGVDFDAIDAMNAADYGRRTDVNREIKRLQAAAAATFPQPSDTPDELPDAPVDEAALLERMTSAAQINADIERERAERERKKEWIAKVQREAQASRERAVELRKQADAADHAADTDDGTVREETERLATLPALSEPVDVSDVRQRIEAARATNAQIARRTERDRLLQQAAEQEFLAEDLTESIEARDKRKRDAVAAAKMPIPGLTLGDGIVMLNGHPLDQASGAEQLRACVAIAMSMKPGLNVIRVRDGNCLDENSLAELARVANEFDCQVWIERCDTSGTMGFVIEDGLVKASPQLEAAE